MEGGETKAMVSVGVDQDIRTHIQWNLSIKGSSNKEHLSNEDSVTVPTT